MRNSENGKYDALLTRTAVYFCTNYRFMLASAVFLCWLRCLKWWCIVYFVCFAVFFFDCSSSRFEKTSEQRGTPAGWRAWPWRVCGRTYVLLFKCCLSASFWERGEKLLLAVFKLQLQGGLLAFCSWVILLFYCYCITIIAPQWDALQRGTWGAYTCCIAVCLFGGCNWSLPCIAPL